VQVFAKRTSRLEIVIRSIDLGVEDRVRTYEELDTYVQVGSEFALAKAALAMCGFLPRFHAEGGGGTLARQLEAFGGGLELSMVAAVPAGSGLGTSSILASTLLGALNELCGLNWDRFSLMRRTLVVEQMLTTGGGWQDQAGALFPGLKLLETPPGLSQKPTVRWLPEHLFTGEYAQSVNLLYYTGLTRLAKNILHEIVRGMFLNAAQRLEDLRGIGENALNTFEAIQRADREALCRAVRTSWELNQRLDAGTNPSAVQSILDRIEEYAAGAKLLGAGGGGYLLILAKDPQSAMRIRQTLEQNPPNARARFVGFSLSPTGLEVTRS
jgi:galactokinase/mevalonate kinase-like predicted kinase